MNNFLSKLKFERLDLLKKISFRWINNQVVYLRAAS